MLYCVGHKNPDTDAICSAIAAAELYNGTPARAGELNKETEFVLNHFEVSVPELITDYNNHEICLLDHNQTTQTPDGIEEGTLVRIVDHHPTQTSPVTTDVAIHVCMKPWGSTSTILAQEFLNEGKDISKPIAGMMLAGILSDTLAFQSPTCTEKDKELAEKLANIAEVSDVKEFAKDMFKAKSDISDLPAKEILQLDYKNFELGGKSIGFGVAETVEPETLITRKQEFLEGLKEVKLENNLDYIFFAIVDILNSHAELLILGEEEASLAKEAFGGETQENIMDIGNRISRKKTMIPPLSGVLIK